MGYYKLRLNEDWILQYPHLANWFNKLHERESVKSTVPTPYNLNISKIVVLGDKKAIAFGRAVSYVKS
jgi:hypothetical protein